MKLVAFVFALPLQLNTYGRSNVRGKLGAETLSAMVRFLNLDVAKGWQVKVAAASRSHCKGAAWRCVKRGSGQRKGREAGR